MFQIEAVAHDPEHVTKGELKLMLQTLLEDRFKVRAHLEMREVEGYNLTIAKSGIKFKETSVDAKAEVTTPTPSYRAEVAHAYITGTPCAKKFTCAESAEWGN